MEDIRTIQSYINNFRRHISRFLKPGVGLSCKVYPAKGEGAVVEFTLGPNVPNEDKFDSSYDTVNTALKTVPQHMIGGNIDAVKFGGTNISMEPDRILLIKGEDAVNLWDDAAAHDDVSRIVAVKGGNR
jgi:hypothetical protein